MPKRFPNLDDLENELEEGSLARRLVAAAGRASNREAASLAIKELVTEMVTAAKRAVDGDPTELD